jgi:alkaline phosphatase D
MRRTWIPVALAIAACVTAVPALADPPPPTPVNFTDGVASGDVTSSRAILWTRVDAPARVSVEVYKSSSLAWWTLRSWGRASTDDTKDFTVKIDVKFLRPSTQYWYRFRSGADTSPVGTFKTAPRAHDEDCWHWWFFGCHKGPTNPNVKFGYTGDSDGTKIAGVPTYNNFGVLSALKNENPDFWVFLGDTIYADSKFRSPPANPTGPGPATTLAQYWAAHREVRSYPNLTNLLASTSTYSLWDDHEVKNDFTAQDVNPAQFAAGRQAFLNYHPVRENFPHDPSCAGDPMYRKVSWGDAVDLFILDLRSCRSKEAVAACTGDLAPTLPTPARQTFPFNLFLRPSPPPGCLAAINDPSRTLLGPVQKAKFKNDLLHSDAQYKMVINEDPIQNFYVLPYDRWEGYGAERNEILDFIRDNSISNTLFLTTDTHATMQNQVFKDYFSDQTTIANEMVTGPIATDTFQTEVIAVANAVGLFAVNQAFNAFTGMDCRNLNQNSYASVDVTAGGTTTITSKDQNGATVIGQNTSNVPTPCTGTYGP